MAVTRIEEGGLGTDSFNLPVTLNGSDGSSTDAGDNIVLDASASGVDAGERLLYEGIPPDFANISDDTSVLAGATLTVNDNGAISVASGGSVTIDSGATFTNNGTATGFGGSDPSSADGDSLGTASLEWSDLYLADGGVVYFGNDQEITLTHSADTGLILKHTATADDKPIVLTLQTGETDIAANDVLGKIAFQAPDEGTGTDAVLVAGAIQVVSEGNFSSSNNAVTMEFHTAASEAAAAKAKLTSTGVFQVGAGAVGGPSISFTSDPDTGMFSVAGDELGIAVGGSRPIYSTNRKVCINDDATANMSSGLCINQTSYDNNIIELKSSDVGHGCTDIAETDSYGFILKHGNTEGGIRMEGITEGDQAMFFRAISANDLSGDTSTSNGHIHFKCHKISGTGIAGHSNTSNLMVVENNEAVQFVLKGNGQLHLTNTTIYALDEEDDAMLIRQLDLAGHKDKDNGPAGVIETQWDKFIEKNDAKLKEIGVLSSENDFIVAQPWIKLANGAIWQQRAMFETMKQVAEEMLPGFSEKLNKRLEEQKLPALPI